jgi:hypothetical protein
MITAIRFYILIGNSIYQFEDFGWYTIYQLLEGE